MASRVDYPMTQEAAAALIAANGEWFKGRKIDRTDRGVSYYASNADHRAFEDLVVKFSRSAARTCATSEPVATDRQISYLSSLIHSDPGAAMTIGASTDGATVRSGLTKSQASRMIETLKSGV